MSEQSHTEQSVSVINPRYRTTWTVSAGRDCANPGHVEQLVTALAGAVEEAWPGTALKIIDAVRGTVERGLRR